MNISSYTVMNILIDWKHDRIQTECDEVSPYMLFKALLNTGVVNKKRIPEQLGHNGF